MNWRRCKWHTTDRLFLNRRDVRFGSLADILRCGAKSTLPPKADILCVERDVRFVPIADIAKIPACLIAYVNIR
jgi:hypothetical protein